MNYELAKKLKDAGFRHKWAEDFDTALDLAHPEDCKCLPTLSELIEMCGENFGELRLSSLVFTEENRWKVTNKNFSADPLVCVLAEGKTPDEAVANLWLELNKNGKE